VPVGIFGLTGRQFASRLLADHQVMVWPGECFGPDGSQHVRISFAGDEGRLRQGLARLGDFIGQLRSRLERWDGKRGARSAERAAATAI
jgi:aspartate/methionine/tyrosine aminotransferase